MHTVKYMLYNNINTLISNLHDYSVSYTVTGGMEYLTNSKNLDTTSNHSPYLYYLLYEQYVTLRILRWSCTSV